MKHLSVIFIIIIISIYFVACQKDYHEADNCTGREVAKFILSDNDRLINPYIGDEVLTFRNVIGDSVVLPNCKRYTKPYYIHEYPYNQRCPGDYVTSYNDRTEIYLKYNVNYLNIILTKHCSFDTPIKWYNTFFLTFSFWGSFTQIQYGGIFFYVNDSLFAIRESDSIIAFHDQITLGPNTFTKVYELITIKEDTAYKDWNTTIYYSLIDGLVGMRHNQDSILWYLARKN